MKEHKIGVISGIIFVVLVAALYIYIYTIPEITGALTETVTVEYGQMRIVKTVDATVIRSEKVINAIANGKTSYYVDNDTKTRKDIKVLDIYGAQNTSMTCPQTGVVSYYVDGYENLLTPDTIENYKNIIPTGGGIKAGDIRTENIKEGEPAYKLITSDTFYTVFTVSPEDINDFTEGSSVSLEFEEASVKAKIDQIIPVYSDDTEIPIDTSDGAIETPEATEYIISVVTAKYCKGYDRYRNCEVNVVLRDDKGLIIPNTAITQQDGNPGVLVKGIDGDYVFTRIKVINTDGTNSVVYADTFSVLREDGLTDSFSTISIYDVIMKNAEEK